MSDAEFLLVITLKQPWATWVLWGWKIVETRVHNRFAKLATHRIGIHAGKTWDDRAMAAAAPYLSREQIDRTVLHDHARGALLCTVFVLGSRPTADCDASGGLIECRTERFGLWLQNIEPFNPPIPMRGHQGIWKARYPL